MKYFYVEPEVAGGFGRNTILDSSVHPPKVTKLNYQFDGWLGDALLECFPCFIVTTSAATSLKKENVSGVIYSDVEVSVSDEFSQLHKNTKLPEFQWLKITGLSKHDDFGIAGDLRLVVSEKALRVLEVCGIQNSLVAAA
jgi:hypothetical protein